MKTSRPRSHDELPQDQRLSDSLARFDQAVEELKGSRPWRVGDALISSARRLLLKPAVATPVHRLEDAVGRVKGLLSEIRDAAAAPESSVAPIPSRQALLWDSLVGLRGLLREIEGTRRWRLGEALTGGARLGNDLAEITALERVKRGLADVEAVVREYLQGSLRAADDRATLLYFLHYADGGTGLTNDDLVGAAQKAYRCVVVKCTLDSWELFEYGDVGPVLLRSFKFGKEWQISEALDPERIKALVEVIEEYGVALAHVRHLIGSAPEILQEFHRRKIPVLFSFHDFYTVCPTISLLDRDEKYCGGRCTPGNRDCRVTGRWFTSIPRLKHAYVNVWRERVAESLTLCDAYVTTSEFARDLLREHFPQLSPERFSLIEHGREARPPDVISVPPSADTVKVVCFGALSPMKGTRLIERLIQLDRQHDKRFEFHVLGTKESEFLPETIGGVYHGPYQRGTLYDRLAEIRPSFSIVASLTPETYCHTLTESWLAGIPAFVSDIGTLKERVLRHGGGWLLDAANPEAWYQEMRRIADAHEEYLARRGEIESMEMRTIEEMAQDYLELYSRLLRGV